MFDFAIIGGGIVGLSTGVAIYQRFPNERLLSLKRSRLLLSIKPVIIAGLFIQASIINQGVLRHALLNKEANP